MRLYAAGDEPEVTNSDPSEEDLEKEAEIEKAGGEEEDDDEDDDDDEKDDDEDED